MRHFSIFESFGRGRRINSSLLLHSERDQSRPYRVTDFQKCQDIEERRRFAGQFLDTTPQSNDDSYSATGRTAFFAASLVLILDEGARKTIVLLVTVSQDSGVVSHDETSGFGKVFCTRPKIFIDYRRASYLCKGNIG